MSSPVRFGGASDSPNKIMAKPITPGRENDVENEHFRQNAVLPMPPTENATARALALTAELLILRSQLSSEKPEFRVWPNVLKGFKNDPRRIPRILHQFSSLNMEAIPVSQIVPSLLTPFNFDVKDILDPIPNVLERFMSVEPQLIPSFDVSIPLEPFVVNVDEVPPNLSTILEPPRNDENIPPFDEGKAYFETIKNRKQEVIDRLKTRLNLRLKREEEARLVARLNEKRRRNLVLKQRLTDRLLLLRFGRTGTSEPHPIQLNIQKHKASDDTRSVKDVTPEIAALLEKQRRLQTILKRLHARRQ